MTPDRRRPQQVAWFLGILIALGLLGPGSRTAAQEEGPLDPSVISILGDPNAAEGNLDADLMKVMGPPEGPPPTEAVLNERAVVIYSKLRCPVCQGVSIADSPAGMATNMREQVRELVGKGYGEEQVLSYFERSYGEFVRLEPPLRGLNVMLWILPAVALVGGGFFVFWKARLRSPAAPASAAPPGSGTPAPDPDLEQYLHRVRRDSGTSS